MQQPSDRPSTGPKPSRFRLDLGVRSLLPDWRELFSTRHLREDALAGITVACVAVPLSLAIALASGVAPAVGLVTAIIAGIVCAFFGGTPLAVSGPAAAMAVLIASVVQDHGVGGLLLVGFLCGVFQLVTGITGLGKLVRYIPVPVIEGFTAGIGAIIFIGQLPRALGLPPPDQSHVFDVVRHLGTYVHQTHPAALILSVFAVAVCLGLPKVLPRIPAPLIAVVVPTIAVALLPALDAPAIGEIPRSLPPPRLPAFPAAGLGKIFGSAVMVFALASLETLLSSTAVDKLATGRRHDPDQELIGQGLGNMVVALFGGIPVTGVIARSALNVQSGAKSRRSSIIHSLTLLVMIFALAPLISRIPLAALAGVLLAVALRMLHPGAIRALWRVSRTEAATYIVTFLVIVLGDLILGVQAGLAFAFLVAAIRLSQVQTQLHATDPGDFTRVSLRGPVTFLSHSNIDAVREEVEALPSSRGLVLDMTDVTTADISGAEMITQFVGDLEKRGMRVAIVGAREDVGRRLEAADQSGKMHDRIAASEAQVRRILDPEGAGERPIDRLVTGARRFERDVKDRYRELFTRLANQQNPHTLFITCSDSRIVTSLVTSTEPGELLHVRNLGNIVPPYGDDTTPAEGAAVEFALGVLKVSEIVVCGHSGCEVMKALVAHEAEALPSVQRWLSSTQALIDRLPKGADASEAARANVCLQLDNLKTYPLVRDKLAAGEVRLHGWYYDLASGQLQEWDEHAKRFVPLTGEEARAIARATAEHAHAGHPHPAT